MEQQYKYDPEQIKIPKSFDRSMLPTIPPNLKNISNQAIQAFGNISDKNTAIIAEKIKKSAGDTINGTIAAASVFNDPKVRATITEAIQNSYQNNLNKDSSFLSSNENEQEEADETGETEEELRNQVETLLRINAELKAKLNKTPKNYAPKMNSKKHKYEDEDEDEDEDRVDEIENKNDKDDYEDDKKERYDEDKDEDKDKDEDEDNDDDDDKKRDDEDEDEDEDKPSKHAKKCEMPKIQKITSSTPVDKMFDYILDAIIVTLHNKTIRLDEILDKIFELIEVVLLDCDVKKGSLGITTAAKIPMITTCLQTKIPIKYVAKMAVVAHKIVSPQGFNKYKTKLMCLLSITDIKSKYNDLKKNLKSKLNKAFDKIKDEAFSYLASGVKLIAKTTIEPMIHAQKSQIINQIVQMSNKIFDELDPMIDMIIKAQKNKNMSPNEMLELLQTQFNEIKGGKRKTRKLYQQKKTACRGARSKLSVKLSFDKSNCAKKRYTKKQKHKMRVTQKHSI